MNEEIRRFLLLRDGNLGAQESWLSKTEKGSHTFEVSFADPMELVENEAIWSLLFAAADVSSTYAKFHFRCEHSYAAFKRCDALLDTFFFPLASLNVLGKAVPLLSTDATCNTWLIELYPIEAVPEEARGVRTGNEILGAILMALSRSKPS